MACLDRDLFEQNPFLDDVQCMICHNIFQTPVSICSNGHVYGEQCIKKWFENNKSCPECQTECKNNYTKMPALIKIVNKLTHKCHNKNCEWKNINGSYMQHIGTCLFETIKCHFCNNFSDKRMYVQEHHKVCPKRAISCEYCKQLFQYDICDDHMKKCESRPENCPECKAVVKGNELPDHIINICQETKIKCKYNCPDLVRKKDLEKHYLENALVHLKYVETYTMRCVQYKIPHEEIPLGKNRHNFTIGNIRFLLMLDNGIFFKLVTEHCNYKQVYMTIKNVKLYFGAHSEKYEYEYPSFSIDGSFIPNGELIGQRDLKHGVKGKHNKCLVLTGITITAIL
jgi:hypothetical protein